MDIATDDAGVWMTYEQLADARDIKRDGARRLAQRHRWRRHTGNDGFARVLVPPDWASATRDITGDVAPDKAKQPAVQSEAVAPDVAGVVAALQGAVDTLRQQLIRADARADELRAEYDHARADAQEARQEVGTLRQAAAAERSRADALRERLDASEARARTAEQAAEQARQHVREAEAVIAELRQADETRRGLGRWARLRTAWRGNS